MTNPTYLFLRAIRRVEHSVFCVANGQKTYKDTTFGYRELAFSSGQQVKRSLLTELVDQMGISEAPITFNFTVERGKGGKAKVGNSEPWSPCDPTYPDQLLGGWMRAVSGGEDATVKRRSPLSISAMRPLHPLLAQNTMENVTFDRSANPHHHNLKIWMGEGKDRKEVTLKEAIDALQGDMRELSPRTWIRDAVNSTTGIFVYDVAIDLRRLFCVSNALVDAEINDTIREKLKAAGWQESKNAFGPCLVCPKAQRQALIPALAKALLEWRITSNQSRTFSLQETLAVALSENANAIAGAIRAELRDDLERDAALVRVDDAAGAEVFRCLPISGYVRGESGSADALAKAGNWIVTRLQAYSDTLPG